MGIRNFYLFGKAYSETSSDISMTVSIEGYGEVFNGSVPTTQGITPEKGTLSEALAAWPTDDETPVSSKNVTITVTGGDVYIVSTGADKIEYGNLTAIVDFDGIQSKTNMSIDGVPYAYSPDIVADGGVEGWHVLVKDGETFVATLTAPDLDPRVPGGIWPTDVNHLVYTKPTNPYPTSYAGKITPTYEQGDPMPTPITIPV